MRKTTEAERRQYVKDCLESGKPRKAWCKERGIPYTTLINWAKKVTPVEEGATDAAVQWAYVTPIVDDTGAPEGAEEYLSSKIRLTSGCFEIRVESGFDPEVLAGILRAVSEVVCF